MKEHRIALGHKIRVITAKFHGLVGGHKDQRAFIVIIGFTAIFQLATLCIF
jgi:hypothetical protein